jgi:hypothetical protein
LFTAKGPSGGTFAQTFNKRRNSFVTGSADKGASDELRRLGSKLGKELGNEAVGGQASMARRDSLVRQGTDEKHHDAASGSRRRSQAGFIESITSSVRRESNQYQLNAHEEAVLKDVFALFDKNGDCHLDREEIHDICTTLLRTTPEDEDVREMMLLGDPVHEGLMSYHEFKNKLASVFPSINLKAKPPGQGTMPKNGAACPDITMIRKMK